MVNILIIEDEKDIVEAIEYNLKKEGFKVSHAYDGPTGLKLAKDKIPDLILLDLMLPDISGLDICKSLKKETRTANIPIIILTAKGTEADKIVGLELGADDYITKPFSMKELITRIRTILRRYGPAEKTSEKILKFDDLEINPDRHEVKVGTKNVELTAKEFALLEHLAKNPGRIYRREGLLDTVWGIEVAIETRTVDVHILRLREKLGKAGKHLQTLRGVGYKFV
ncbi:MAG: response regulator [Candidatus Saganbacteria bacterium]|nr:response regulator [Candidatus Saganbacteria bacterium]